MGELTHPVNDIVNDKVIPELTEVQVGLDDHADHMAAIASAILAAHRVKGHSYITVEKVGALRGIDRLVTLNDEQGQAAANIIESGRKGTGSRGPSRGVRPLRTAVNQMGGNWGDASS